MEGKHRIVINNTKHTLHRLGKPNTRLSLDEDEQFRSIMYKIIEDLY